MPLKVLIIHSPFLLFGTFEQSCSCTKFRRKINEVISFHLREQSGFACEGEIKCLVREIKSRLFHVEIIEKSLNNKVD